MYRSEVYQGSLARVHVSLPGLITAWGTDILLSPGGGIINVKVNGNSVCQSATCQIPTFNYPTAAFFGMSSDTPFNSLDFYYPTSTYLAIDNFSTAVANTQTPGAETPEVCTFLLCAGGLIGLSKAKKLRFLLAA